jgi:Rod binding domain-containing protein
MDGLALPPSSLTTTVSAPKARPMDRARAMEVARDFESVYIADAFKLMLQDVATDPVTGSTSGDSWRELLVDEYAKEISRRGGFGLAGPIADTLLKIQEAATP